MKELNRYFDHTNLKPEATSDDIRKLCGQAKTYQFYAVCVNSSYVRLAAKELAGSSIKIVAVTGFPLGACSTEVKAYEADDALRRGADEIDMVMHIGALKEKRYDYVKSDIAAVVSIAREYDAVVKVIIETSLLTKEEIVKSCELAREAGADFVKTSTGFSGGAAAPEEVKLMKDTIGDVMKVKASGGIRALNTALAMIAAGADRLGASASMEIFDEFNHEKG